MTILFCLTLGEMKMNVIHTALSLMLVALLFGFDSCSGPKSGGNETVATESDLEMESEDENSAEDKSKRPSPMMRATATIGSLTVKINYSSPRIKERTIWGGLVPYDEIWRTGANEATVFAVSQDVLINGETLAAGKYALFTIPRRGDWIVIFNTVWDQWGSYNYEKSKDALRIGVPPKDEEETRERMEFQIDDQGLVRFHWDKLSLSFSVQPA